jgi:hypothetical protein
VSVSEILSDWQADGEAYLTTSNIGLFQYLTTV